MSGTGTLERLGEQFGAIRLAVVGHHPLDPGSQPGVPCQCPVEEPGGIIPAQAWQQFDIGEAGGIVDGDMQVFVADASGAMMSLVLARDPVANAVDTAQGLDVDMDQFARPLPFVAGRGSSQASLFSPSRRSTRPTVERARPRTGQLPARSCAGAATARSATSAWLPADAGSGAALNCDRAEPGRRPGSGRASDKPFVPKPRPNRQHAARSSPVQSVAPKALDLTASDAHSYGRSFGELH